MERRRQSKSVLQLLVAVRLLRLLTGLYDLEREEDLDEIQMEDRFMMRADLELGLSGRL